MGTHKCVIAHTNRTSNWNQHKKERERILVFVMKILSTMCVEMVPYYYSELLFFIRSDCSIYSSIFFVCGVSVYILKLIKLREKHTLALQHQRAQWTSKTGGKERQRKANRKEKKNWAISSELVYVFLLVCLQKRDEIFPVNVMQLIYRSRIIY